MNNRAYNNTGSTYQVNPGNNFEMNIDYETRDYSTRSQRVVQTIVDLVAIIAVFVVFVLVYFLQDPKIRYFTCQDNDIFFPYIPDTIEFWVVGIYGILGPILVILLVELLNSNFLPCQKEKNERCRTFWIALFHALSLFVLGIAIVLCLTEIGKRWVGRLRPHFMDVCKPDWSKVDCRIATLDGYVYNSISTGGSFCTGDADKIKEARFSFPSGHSSFSWYTMLFTIIYLEARLVLIRFRFIKTIFQMTCFIAAFVTMLSRISDYHHRGSDVLGGAVLGIIVALGITLFVGRVLWMFDKKPNYADFDLKEKYRF